MLWLSNHSLNPATGRPEAHHLWPFARLFMAVLGFAAFAFLALAGLLATSGAIGAAAIVFAIAASLVAAAVHHGRIRWRPRSRDTTRGCAGHSTDRRRVILAAHSDQPPAADLIAISSIWPALNVAGAWRGGNSLNVATWVCSRYAAGITVHSL